MEGGDAVDCDSDYLSPRFELNADDLVIRLIWHCFKCGCQFASRAVQLIIHRLTHGLVAGSLLTWFGVNYGAFLTWSWHRRLFFGETDLTACKALQTWWRAPQGAGEIGLEKAEICSKAHIQL